MKCLIIEDEKPAQLILQKYIDQTQGLSCIGIYGQPTEVDLHLVQQVDLLFLDIQMPLMSGISYLKSLASPPLVIFTTAFDAYAVEAFALQVVDYLVKPFGYERFLKAVQLATQRQQLATPTQLDASEVFFVYADKTFYKLTTQEILWIEAAVDYVKIHTLSHSYLVMDSLANWEQKLAKKGFVRIHRSYLINLQHLTKIQGNQAFIGNQALAISKTFKALLMQQLNLPKNS